ncbi:MAG: BCD family MFS transporter [Gemmatimonadota bacterium]
MGWLAIARLGLVQVAIGAVVVLMTSTLNRVMVVELALPATVPGLLVGLHFAVQLVRPRMGWGSDATGRRTPWIVGGMAVVAASGLLAAVATAWMATSRVGGVLLALAAFTALGAGVSASSTPLLAYLAERVEERRMAGAAALTWIMMIVGIILTAGFAGSLLDPFSMERLVTVTAGVTSAAMVLTVLAVWGREKREPVLRRSGSSEAASEAGFREAFAELWADPQARRFALFVFVSMLAYSAQDIILEPFAGTVFGLTPGESTQVGGVQHGGVLLGMIGGAVVASRFWTLHRWSAIGCVASAIALGGLVSVALTGSVTGLQAAVFGLGTANGLYAVAAIGAMMGVTARQGSERAGLAMGFWGASQAAAYGIGGLAGAAASDLARSVLGSPVAGYAFVFLAQAALFVVAVLGSSITP